MLKFQFYNQHLNLRAAIQLHCKKLSMAASCWGGMQIIVCVMDVKRPVGSVGTTQARANSLAIVQMELFHPVLVC
jgi:hypothetical protein